MGAQSGFRFGQARFAQGRARGEQLRVANRVANVAGVGGIGALAVTHRRQVIAERQPAARQVGLQANRVTKRLERLMAASGTGQGDAQFQMCHRPIGLGDGQGPEDFHGLLRFATHPMRGA